MKEPKEKASGRRYKPLDQGDIKEYQQYKDAWLAIRRNPEVFASILDKDVMPPYFEQMLEEKLAKTTKTLQRLNLPATPHIWTNQDTPGEWQPTRAGSYQIKTYLPEFVLSQGYAWDSEQHLSAKMLCILYEIDGLSDWRRVNERLDDNHAAVFFRLALELGQIETLLGVKKILRAEASEGGRNKPNPWREYGKQLLAKYQHLSKGQIWKKIPKSPEHDLCEGYALMRRVDGAANYEEEYLVAEANDSSLTKEIKKSSFSVQYLTKPKQKKS